MEALTTVKEGNDSENYTKEPTRGPMEKSIQERDLDTALAKLLSTGNSNKPGEEVDKNGIVLKRQFGGYPISVPFIISLEFCERFSFYGIQYILTIYFTKKLLMDEEEAILWFHEFAALSYVTPLIGAIIADVFIGKFMTILIMSMVYLVGIIMMALSAVGSLAPFRESVSYDETSGMWNYVPKIWGPLLALHLIALGSGGMKPCVCSFGGDQFRASDTIKIQRFFSLFYFSVNAGALLATGLTPELRVMACLGESTCYPLAFGVPAFLFLIASAGFLAPSRCYVKVPPLGNPIIDVAKVSWAMAFGEESPESLYGAKKVDQTRQLFRVLIVFLPFPVFYALFDQQSSRWVIQADRMNGKLGTFEIKPDQMQIFNPILVMCLIPVFEIGVYPLMNKMGIATNSTFRMIMGMFLAAVSFIVCGFVQLAMETRVATWNDANPGDIRTLDTFDKELQIHVLTQIPQIFILACSEIMTSITITEFAYAYAPPAMKSVCMSISMLTIAFGNVIVMIFIEVTDRDLYQFFMWSGIQLIAVLLMIFVCRSQQGALEECKAREIAGEAAIEMSDKNTDIPSHACAE